MKNYKNKIIHSYKNYKLVKKIHKKIIIFNKKMSNKKIIIHNYNNI